ncbi:hypothetical protein CYMTET_17991 [Cymbomonas tetramitiformis]|uniref:Uncharacterized protein n=1 Tax=Cymbomonas tetramitiformis TaxID=36881 RepID=A0AAE0G9C3_9CHLO|nr:hypothetical protein CYMTET_17991 [Cymbomonas tetramitiformis]
MLVQTIESYMEAYTAGIATSQHLQDIDSQVMRLEQIIMLALNSSHTLILEEDEAMAGMTPRTPMHEGGSRKGSGMYSAGMGMSRADFGGLSQMHQGYTPMQT